MTPRPVRHARPIRAFYKMAGKCLTACAALVAAGGLANAQDAVIRVPSDIPSLQEAVAGAPNDALIRIAPGRYAGPIRIQRPVTLRGDEAGDVYLIASDRAPVIEISATTNVTLQRLHIVGGSHGIFVQRSQGITIRENIIRGSRLAGVRVRLAAAAIFDNRIIDTRPPYGRGIELSNSAGLPLSIVAGNTVSGHPLDGIVLNMASLVRIENNYIGNNRKNGIAVREMSRALILDNVIDQNVENGIYVLDYSLATVCRNTLTNTYAARPKNGVRYGNGILVDFYSRLVLGQNALRGYGNADIRTLAHAEITKIPVITQNDSCGTVYR